MVREELILRSYKDGTKNDSTFHNIVITDYTYETSRMGFPTITATIYYPTCLDDEWDGTQYVVFRGEEYFINETPDSTKANDNALYKHEITFRSGREILAGVLFYDSVPDHASDTIKNKYRSESATTTFYGTIFELAERLNCAMLQAGVGDSILNTKTNLVLGSDTPVGDGYCCLVDPSGADVLYNGEDSWEFSFDEEYISDAINSAYETCEVPFEYRGKTIVWGAYTEPLEKVFKYGVDNELLSISKKNANAKVINRITFKGSEDNIPYYYPNESEYGDVSVVAGSDNAVVKQSSITINNKDLLARSIPQGSEAVFCKTDLSNESDVSSRLYVEYVSNSDSTNRSFTLADFGEYYTDLEEVSTKYFYLYFDVETIVDDQQLTIDFLAKRGIKRYPKDYEDYQSVGLSDCESIELRYIGEEEASYSAYSKGTSYTSLLNTETGIISGLRKVGGYMLRFRIVVPKSVTTTGISYGSAVERATMTYHVDKYSYYWKVGTSAFSDVEKLGISINATLDDSALGDTISTKFDISSRIAFQTNLMPPKYRQTLGKERFYNAQNNTYIDPDTGNYYVFPNPYVKGKPCEHIFTDEDIKPTIEGITNSQGQLFGQIVDIAYDSDDNDSLKTDADSDSDTDSANYMHSYFYIKLNIFDGNYGFDLFARASQTDAMTIQMISGNCNGCKFKVKAVQFTNTDGTYYYKNPVQVKEANGDIVDGSFSDKVVESSFQSFQQDTSKNSIWICVQKDASTFGVIMPNQSHDYKPSIGDKFNITNIYMPQSYIDAAEKRGEEEMLRYMADNNEEKFTFDISMSRIFFAQNPDILAELDENSRITVEYNDKQYTLYVSTFKITCSNDTALPEISVDLDDEITVGESFTQNVAERVSSLIANAYTLGGALSSGSGSSGLSAALARQMFLSKTTADSANGHITFNDGLTSKGQITSDGKITAISGVQLGESYVGGLLGVGGKLNGDGSAELRSLKLWEFLEVPELRYNSVSVYTGIRWDTFGGGLIESVEIDTDSDGNELQSGIITLKLESGQIGAIAQDDLCMGIFHNFIGENDTENTDSRSGNFTFAGFNTCYFRITEILDTDTNSRFRYTLRGTSDTWNKQAHPSSQMTFACYANPTDTSRQWCVYTTTQYSIGLKDMTTWEYSEDNIYKISGLLEGFTLSGKSFEGVGEVLGNAYIYGSIEQFENAPLVLDISITGNNPTIARGEIATLVCTLKKGFEDVTDTVKSWSIVRETSDTAADTTWSKLSKVTDFAGSIELTWSDISDSNDIVSAMFTITATTTDNQKVKAKIS